MKIIEGFRLRNFAGVHAVVNEGISNINFNKIISLNDTAAYLWESVDGKDFTVEDLTALLLDKYEVDRETAARDSATIAQKWVEAGVVSE